MTEGIWIALITNFIILLGYILTFISQMKKLRGEQNKRDEDNKLHQSEQLEKFKKMTQDSIADLERKMSLTLATNRTEYMAKIDDVYKAQADTNGSINDVKATCQTTFATIELRLQNMADQFNDMKTEVREHNNFAKKMPVLEEQIKVANHRIQDLENDGK